MRCEEFRWERQALLEADGRNTKVDQTLRLLPNIFLSEYSEEVLQLPPEHLFQAVVKGAAAPSNGCAIFLHENECSQVENSVEVGNLLCQGTACSTSPDCLKEMVRRKFHDLRYSGRENTLH